MALTRKFLSALGIEGDKVDEIIAAHAESIDALKEQIAQYKQDAEKMNDVQKQLDAANKLNAENAEKLKGFAGTQSELDKLKAESEKKYSELKAEYANYKTAQTEKATRQAKENAYRQLLTNAGVSDKRLDSILKVTNLANIQLDKDGNIKDSDKLKDDIKSEWSDFIVTNSVKGANVSNPLSNTGGKMTRDEIMKIKDAGERQRKIAENHELFGF